MYRLNAEQALIQTLDFFTPIVDDPYSFGRIAAANALSDVYAMGGRPVLALNIVGFPKTCNLDLLTEILRGGADKVHEAGAVIVGGHSIDDPEPKYGLSVSGLVHPDRIWQNRGSVVGDVLILTKPVGTGLYTTAAKGDMLDDAATAEVIETMAELNKYAAEAMIEAGVPVHACTDITGFGLLGHLSEMIEPRRYSIELWCDQVPVLPKAEEFARIGLIPAGTYRNKEFVKPFLPDSSWLQTAASDYLCDPQTSGGLVFAVPSEDREKALQAIRASQSRFDPVVIGRVIDWTGDYFKLGVK